MIKLKPSGFKGCHGNKSEASSILYGIRLKNEEFHVSNQGIIYPTKVV